MKPAQKLAQVEILVPAAVDGGFDYAVPSGLSLAPGDIVSVPLGKKQALGVVWGEGAAKLPPEKMRPVASRYDLPPLSSAMRKFIDWVAWYTLAPRGMVLKMVLPIAEVDKEGRKKFEPVKLDAKNIQLPELSAVQETAAHRLEQKLGKGFSVTLLDGVTGSGKTEVYFDMIAKALAMDVDMRPAGRAAMSGASCEGQKARSGGAQILVLLPEIALSVQWLKRFEERFGFAPVIWNSEITPATRRVSWQAIAKGEARVVVGARSALFLPYTNLSLLIVDEEHDSSYKQEEGVIYHARDMAVARARFEAFPVVLVSATPSLESYYNARQGKYDEVILPVRHAEAVLPDVETIDMRRALLGRGAFISAPLREALAQTLADGHQAMLFLNRRGYAPLVLCRSCGHRFQCPDCSTWLVMHKSKPRMECHHCNYTAPIPDTCPACGAEENLHACGPGVERIHEEVTQFLPEARVAVMASDSSGSFKALSETINAMIEKRIDILIGTQMIAKGHHFADLGAVGVVDADLGLAGGDLRAAERTYQLLHQLSGRAGREHVRGKVYLQSFCTEHPVMQALVSGDREAFLSTELESRRIAHMPPFSRLAAIIVEGAKEGLVIKAAHALAAAHTARDKVQLLGPAPAPLYRLSNRFRMRLLLRAERTTNLSDYIRGWLASVALPSSIRTRADIDPQSFL